MPRVQFTITYGIKPEMREEYLAFVKEMKAHFAALGTKEYAVYEVRGKKNQFAEVFMSASIEEFDALEDNQDEQTQALVARLERFLDADGMKYTTLIEVE
jgi:L-rhamnose mutarotase